MGTTLYYTTTRFHSFTDGHIPSVCDRTFVGKVFTDYITDGILPSEYLLSVIPHSVAISVGNKKTRLPTVLPTVRARQKKKSFPLGIYRRNTFRRCYVYTDRINPSVNPSVLLYRRIISVGEYVGIFTPTDYCRRWGCRWWDGIPQTLSNADRFIPSVNPCVIFFFNYLEKII